MADLFPELILFLHPHFHCATYLIFLVSTTNLGIVISVQSNHCSFCQLSQISICFKMDATSAIEIVCTNTEAYILFIVWNIFHDLLVILFTLILMLLEKLTDDLPLHYISLPFYGMVIKVNNTEEQNDFICMQWNAVLNVFYTVLSQCSTLFWRSVVR
jgi:hypothetical protein